MLFPIWSQPPRSQSPATVAFAPIAMCQYSLTGVHSCVDTARGGDRTD
jgi:hypothetical protein